MQRKQALESDRRAKIIFFPFKTQKLEREGKLTLSFECSTISMKPIEIFIANFCWNFHFTWGLIEIWKLWHYYCDLQSFSRTGKRKLEESCKNCQCLQEIHENLHVKSFDFSEGDSPAGFEETNLKSPESTGKKIYTYTLISYRHRQDKSTIVISNFRYFCSSFELSHSVGCPLQKTAVVKIHPSLGNFSSFSHLEGVYFELLWAQGSRCKNDIRSKK